MNDADRAPNDFRGVDRSLDLRLGIEPSIDLE
jgi:hypothetical protein